MPDVERTVGIVTVRAIPFEVAQHGTGFGITRNIIDCYAEIIRLYETGDRIFLFGFSRGAYTVRCVGGVMSLCGIPTQSADGKPLKIDAKSVRKIAEHGVKYVYQHGAGHTTGRFAEILRAQREELGRLFRKRHSSQHSDGEKSNVAPYFIGVWDTVASTGYNFKILAGVLAILLTICALFAWGSSWFIASGTFWSLFFICFMFVFVVSVIAMAKMRIRFSNKLKDPWLKTVHITGWKMKFYNHSLNPNVQYAKHALAIDKHRKDFDRVRWSDHGDRTNDDRWFEQVWF